MKTLTTPCWLGSVGFAGLLTFASCVQLSTPVIIEPKSIDSTNEPSSIDHDETESPNHRAKNNDAEKTSGATGENDASAPKETFTLSGTTVSIDPKTCTVEVDWKGQRFSETLEAVGDPHVMCMVSRRANGEIQEYAAERGTAIVIGSSSKPDKEGWCDVQLHGLLITRTGPEISVTPQKPKICGVHNRDEILFALLAYETKPMKLIP